MNVVLIGFMGTGKTVVGKRLAKRFGWRFVEIDELIETSAKMSIPKIFAGRGEAVFRRLERRHISRVIHKRNQVITTGGGAFVDTKNRARLRASGVVVCLEARPQVILKRVERNISARPMLAGDDPLKKIRALLQKRASAYAQADLTIETSHLSVAAVVERLWNELGPYLCRSWEYLCENAKQLSQRYAGQYVAVVEDHIVASGTTQLEVYQKIPQKFASKGDTGIYYIPLPQESVTAL